MTMHQARDHQQRLLWQHTCGAVTPMKVDPAEVGCWQCAAPGAWSPLLVQQGAPDDRRTLALPEVDPSTQVLISNSTGAHWDRRGRVWRHREQGAVRNLAQILWIEHLGGGSLTEVRR